MLGVAVGGQEVLAATRPALTLHLQGGRALSIVGIAHVHALVSKLTSVNDETPAGPLAIMPMVLLTRSSTLSCEGTRPGQGLALPSRAV